MKTEFFAFVLASLLFSCHSNPTNGDNSQTTASLSGQWLWTRTSGGIAGQVILPTSGTRVIHTYTVKGKYFSHRNDTLLFSTWYTVRKEKSIYSMDSLDVIVFQDSSQNKQVIMQLTKDSLNLGDNYYDGYGSTFIRIN